VRRPEPAPGWTWASTTRTSRGGGLGGTRWRGPGGSSPGGGSRRATAPRPATRSGRERERVESEGSATQLTEGTGLVGRCVRVPSSGWGSGAAGFAAAEEPWRMEDGGGAVGGEGRRRACR
jgi:hypothetical protein